MEKKQITSWFDPFLQMRMLFLWVETTQDTSQPTKKLLLNLFTALAVTWCEGFRTRTASNVVTNTLASTLLWDNIVERFYSWIGKRPFVTTLLWLSSKVTHSRLPNMDGVIGTVLTQCCPCWGVSAGVLGTKCHHVLLSNMSGDRNSGQQRWMARLLRKYYVVHHFPRKTDKRYSVHREVHPNAQLGAASIAGSLWFHHYL